MNEVLIVSALMKLGYASIAICLVVFILKGLDRMLKVNFDKDVWGEIDNGNVAVAQYMGLRFVGCCWLVAQLLG